MSSECHSMSSLSPNQLKAIPLLAQGLTPPHVAAKLRVSHRTIQRWFKVSEFQEALNQVRVSTQSKLIEKTSEAISDGLNINVRQLQQEHIQLYSRFRKLAELCLAHHEEKFKESPDDCNLKQLSILVQVVDRSIRGEADSAFFHYLDLDAAIRAVASAGYKIYDETQQPREEVSSLDLN